MLRVWQDGRIVQCKNDADLVCYPIDAELHKQGKSLLNWVCEYKIPVRAPSPLIPPHPCCPLLGRVRIGDGVSWAHCPAAAPACLLCCWV